MERIDVTRRTLDKTEYKFRKAVDTDGSIVVSGDTALYEDGVLKVVYVELPEMLLDMRAAVLKAPCFTYSRTAGLKACSCTFGYLPRNPLFHDFCKMSKWHSFDQRTHTTAMAHAALVDRYYALHNPGVYARHKKEVHARVNASWRMGDSVFTSGIVNKSTPLAYHFDGGNFKDVWSGMLTFKRGIEGGDLALPEYDVVIKLRDRSLLLFDGQGLMHGVTPITRTQANGYRYTAVYYSTLSLWQCLPPGEELQRVRGKRDAMESNRAANMDAPVKGTKPRKTT